MEKQIVELRKINVTKSILSQIECASQHEFFSHTPLGWYLWTEKGKSERRILLYSQGLQDLKWYPWFQHPAVKPFKLESESVQIDSHGTRETQYFVEIETNRSSSFYNKWQVPNKTSKEETEALLEKLTLKRHQINTQIFY